VLHEEFPRVRERRTRKPIPQETESQVAAGGAVLQEEQPAITLPEGTMEALTQAIEDAKAAGEPVDAIAEAVADGEAIKAEIIGDVTSGRFW
jgi:hypothetical protein